jgi:hypothetical protein
MIVSRWSSTGQQHHPGRCGVGFLGRIDPKKNIDVLLRAIALLPPSFSLVIAGDGQEKLKQQLVALVTELGIQDRVKWRGFVNAHEKDDFFRSIDVLVMPSQFESFGIVAVEIDDARCSGDRFTDDRRVRADQCARGWCCGSTNPGSGFSDAFRACADEKRCKRCRRRRSKQSTSISRSRGLDCSSGRNTWRSAKLTENRRSGTGISLSSPNS